MPRLDRIEVEGFKSIRELRLELRPLNVLIGANGAGKSNLISVFGFLHDVVEGRLQVAVTRAGGASRLLHYGPKRTPAMRLKVSSGINEYEARLAHATGDRLFFESETAWGMIRQRDANAFRLRMGGGHAESKLGDEATGHPGGVAAWVLERVDSWRVHHFHDTGVAAPVKQSNNLDDNAALRTDAGNLAAFLYRLRHEPTTEPHYKRIIAAVRQVAPFFEDLSLRPNPLNPRTIQLEWVERGSDAYFDAHSMSDGTLRFLCLATLLLQPEPPSLIIIDEPELGLHPFAIAQLAAMLRSVVERPGSQNQVLLATQSVTLMNQFDADDVIVVDRDQGQSTFRRPSGEEVAAWLEDYALGDLWEKNVIGGRPQRP